VICRLDRNGFGELGTADFLATFLANGELDKLHPLVLTRKKVNRGGDSTYTASSKFFSAMALLPRAFSWSAMLRSGE
jgi:hypothetical protein